jgi:dCTP deaminase
MILSDSAIMHEMKAGNIVITPNTYKVNPASIDLTLGASCKTFKRETKSVKNKLDLPYWVLSNKLWFEVGNGRYYYYDCLDLKNPNQEYNKFDITEDGFVLIPNKGYLFACNEHITIGRNLAARVDGKSSLGRYFVKIHETAGFVVPNFSGKIVLEVTCQEPIRIYPNIPICQLIFYRVEGIVNVAYGEGSNDKYQGQDGVQASKYYLNFKK